MLEVVLGVVQGVPLAHNYLHSSLGSHRGHGCISLLSVWLRVKLVCQARDMPLL